MRERTFCPEGERQMTAYLEGRLQGREREAFAGHVAQCAACRGEVELWDGLNRLAAPEPGPYFRGDFERMMAREVGRLEVGRASVAWWRQSAVAWGAAAVLAVGGFFAGSYFGAREPRVELSEVREEMKSMRRLVAMSLMQQQSAVERLRGVSYSVGVEGEDEQVVGALISTLRADSSVDVRMAAADALRKYSGRPKVRQAMADSLLEQESPMLQMTLIDALVELQERKAGVVFARMEKEMELEPGVKKRLRRAMEELRVQ